ncbi:MAG: amidohydrolase family protein [Pyrinomonadaceae bacterium]
MQKERVKIIRAGQLFDGVSDTFLTDVSIVVRNERISEIVSGEASFAGAEIINLNEYTVLPGFIDCHTHLTFEIGKGEKLSDLLLRRDSDNAIRATAYARRTLLAGFTTVRDVGAPNFIDVSLRDAINAGYIFGPRMFVSGPFVTITGGHADLTAGLCEHVLRTPNYQQGVIDTPEEGVKAVNYLCKHGVNNIKIIATGGVISVGDSGSGQLMSESLMTPIVRAAHLLGRKVACHAHGAEGMKDAMRAGVNSIEHGSYLDDEAIALFNQTGSYLVPTISPAKHTLKMAETPNYYPPEIEEKIREVSPLVGKACNKAYQNKVKIAFGTDAGVYPHGDNAKEFQYLVEAGVSPIDALFMATRNAADLIGKSNDVGSVQAGRFADLVAVKGNPLEDITLLQNISFVMKAGIVYKDETAS